jgi:hypothetical protein
VGNKDMWVYEKYLKGIYERHMTGIYERYMKGIIMRLPIFQVQTASRKCKVYLVKGISPISRYMKTTSNANSFLFKYSGCKLSVFQTFAKVSYYVQA